MSFKNIYITQRVSELDVMKKEDSIEMKPKDVDTENDNEDSEEVPARAVFKRTLPLTRLEQKAYVLVNHYGYLKSEIIFIFFKICKYIWIVFLGIFICYFDVTIVNFLLEQNPDFKISITVEKIIRMLIVVVYMIIALIFIICEPIAARLHHKLLLVFYPKIAERRAKILMLIIKLQRKSFIKINRLNIHLRFNKVGNVWTAIKGFLEE